MVCKINKYPNITGKQIVKSVPLSDKKIFQDAKTQMKKEFTGEVTYILDEPVEQALQSDLEPLNAIVSITVIMGPLNIE